MSGVRLNGFEVRLRIVSRKVNTELIIAAPTGSFSSCEYLKCPKRNTTDPTDIHADLTLATLFSKPFRYVLQV